MVDHRSTSTTDRPRRRSLVPWEPLQRHVPHAFLLAGASLLASLLVPPGLLTATGWSWLAGIALAGLSAGTGLLGLYPAGRTRTPRLAVVGGVAAAVAAAAGLTVIALSAATASAVVLPGTAFSVGTRAFVPLALAVAGGYALGFLAFGVAGIRSTQLPRRTGGLLAAGGLLLAVPAVGGLAQLAVGVRLPAWVLLPVLGLVATDTVAVGLGLRSTARDRSSP